MASNRATRLLNRARSAPTTVDIDSIYEFLAAASSEDRASAAEALGWLNLSGREVPEELDRLTPLLKDAEVLGVPARLVIDEESGETLQPRAVAFAIGTLLVEERVGVEKTLNQLVTAQERRYPELDVDRKSYTALRDVGWALASINIYTDKYLNQIIDLTESNDATVRRAGAVALSDIAEEYQSVWGQPHPQRPYLVSVATELLQQDSHQRVRYHAAFAIHEFGLKNPESIRHRMPTLRMALSDEYALVRKEIVGLLGVIGATEALADLKQIADNDPNSDVREKAEKSIAQLTRS